MSEPSSSRTLSTTLSAMKPSTASGMPSRCSDSAFLRRIARRVSNSGGWMSVIRPHSKRLRSRSSMVAIDFGRPVGGDHDLAAAAVQVVERVEELLLELLGALEELDVVDEQHVDLAVAPFEARHVLRAHRVDELVHHRLGRDVANALAREELADVVADRVQQVGLAQPGRAVDEQRVVGPGRALGDRQRGRVREAVRGADDELVEGVAGIQRRGEPGRAGVRARRRGGARRPPSTTAGGGVSWSRRRPAPRGGAWCRRAGDVERDAGEGLGGVGRAGRGSWCGAARSATELGTPSIRVSSLQVEGVHPLEPGVPGGFRQLGADRRSHLCPQVIGSRCPHGGGSPGLSTAYVHRCAEARRPGVRVWPRSVGPIGGGSAERRIGPGAPGSRTISALWTTQQAASGGPRAARDP